MISLKVLLASNRDDAAAIKNLIDGRLDQKMPGMHIAVQVVETLAEVLVNAESSNVIILHLHLADASPDAVIAAIPNLPEPVIVFTKIIDPEIHSRCKIAGALVLVEGEVREAQLCSSILHCLGRSVISALKSLPAE